MSVLKTTIDLATDFVPGGVIKGNPDLTQELQDAIISAYNNKVTRVTVNGVFKISSTILVYPGVEICGFGADFTYISASAGFPKGGTMFRFYNPNMATGIRRNSHSAISGVVLQGNDKNNGIVGVDIGDSLFFKLSRMQFGNLIIGVAYNKYIYDTRVTVNNDTTYPNAIDTVAGGMSYYGIVEQCDFQSCVNGQFFYGIFNRNTATGNSYRDCNVAYNFSNNVMVSETNTFISDNIEGCHSAFEWKEDPESIYNNTWITTSVDNSNSFTSLVKDPGRQTFINLSLFPYNDNNKVSFYSIFPGRYSDVLGSNTRSAAPTSGVGHRTREVIEATAGIRNKVFGTQMISLAIPAGENKSKIIGVPGLTSGAAIAWSLDTIYPTLIMNCYSTSAGAVTFVAHNTSAAPITINARICVSGISKSFL